MHNYKDYYINIYNNVWDIKENQFCDNKLIAKLPDMVEPTINKLLVTRPIINKEFLPDRVSSITFRANSITTLEGIGRNYLKECNELRIRGFLNGSVLGLSLIKDVYVIFDTDDYIKKMLKSGNKFMSQFELFEKIEVMKKLEEIIEEEINVKPQEKRDVLFFQERLLIEKSVDLIEFAKL